MNTRQHSLLENLNRALIVALTSGGLLMDGIQLADLFCTAALLVWLWLPLFTRLEARLFHRIAARQGRPGQRKPLHSFNPTNGISHYRSQP